LFAESPVVGSDVRARLLERAWRGVLSFLVAAFLAAPGHAASPAAVLVVDASTGDVLEAIEPNHRWYPASLTKMMTVYLAFREIEAKRLALGETLSVSEHAAAQPGTELGLAAGDTMTAEQAILATILQSANDAAVVLAERIAGSEEAFAASMTTTARSLGMTRTVFRNASGLPNPEQITTARDMAILARALLRDFPQHYHFFSAQSFTFGNRSYPTINGILSHYPGADGIKTGFTCGSGYNLVASAQRDGRRLIGVVLGARTPSDRIFEMASLLDFGFGPKSVADKPQQILANVGTPPAVDEADPAPLQQLPEGQCAIGVAATPDSKVGRLPGWGLVLGAYFSRGEASAVIGKAEDYLRSVAPGGHPMLIPRRWGGVRSYAALLVGLGQAEAAEACKRLRAKGMYCQALNPQALNNRNAVWR
jgi:D-alanyl-D-alanine carboxypeptidase